MKKCVITGSFNPVTSGHIYLLEQSLKLFDEVYMVMFINPDKTYELSVEERFSRLKTAVEGYNNVIVDYSSGYACDYCEKVGAKVMVRGVRDAKDLVYELDLRKQNLDYKGIDTIILITDDRHRNISSTYVRENGHE